MDAPAVAPAEACGDEELRNGEPFEHGPAPKAAAGRIDVVMDRNDEQMRPRGADQVFGDIAEAMEDGFQCPGLWPVGGSEDASGHDGEGNLSFWQGVRSGQATAFSPEARLADVVLGVTEPLDWPLS